MPLPMQFLLKKAPPVEAGFWTYSCPIFPNEDPEQLTTKKSLVYLDFRVLFGACGWMMCPSITLRQAFIDSVFQEEAHQINPVIGISTPEDIRTGGLKGYRDMAIPYPGHPLPKTADHLPAPDILDFMGHDFYHAVRASMLNNSDIVLIIAIADTVKQLKTSFQQEYSNVNERFQNRKKRFERSISKMPLARKNRRKDQWQKHEYAVNTNNKLQYLKHTTRALGQLAFNLYDLETHKPVLNTTSNNSDKNQFEFHLSNILFQLNRSSGEPWRALLSETDAGIVGQCIIPMISGNLSNRREMYNYFCSIIDKDVNSPVNQKLSQTEKQEYVARSRKLIEPLNQSVQPDQSQWSNLPWKAIRNGVQIPNLWTWLMDK